MLGSTVLEIGPFNVPIWLLTAVSAYVVTLIIVRFFKPEHRETFRGASDLLTAALAAGLLVWKLTPLATRFPEISSGPARLLYYPGGTAGLIAGAAAAIVTAIVLYFRKRDGGRRAMLIAAGVTLLFVGLPVTVISLIPAGANEAASPPEATMADITAGAHGRPTVLVFWATWCGPCSAQMPELQRFHEQYGDDVQLLAVNLTATEGSADAVSSYIDENGLTLPVVLDRTDELRRAFEVEATPTTIVLDPGGTELARRTGAVTSVWIERRVLPFRE